VARERPWERAAGFEVSVRLRPIGHGLQNGPSEQGIMPAMAEVVMLRVMSVERDAWAWAQYALSVIAAITAIIVFSAWAAELRRRPEIRFYWRLSPDGDPANLTIWPPDQVPEIKMTQPFLVEAAIQNTGDKAGRDTLINFVVPDCFDLRQCAAPEVEPPHAGNDTAGLPPDNRVVFFAPRPEPWTPVNWHLRQYRLQYVADQRDRPLPVRLLFTVTDSRFNSRGWRWLPSIVPPLESLGAPVGTPWPPTRSRRRKVRWARAEPHGRVACLPGERSDVRDLIVVPAEEGHAAAVTRSRGWREWWFLPRWRRTRA
jgi:hypothetical protein